MCHIAIRQSITDYNFLMVCMHNLFINNMLRKKIIYILFYNVTKMMPIEPGGLEQGRGDNILHLAFQYWMSGSGWPSA